MRFQLNLLLLLLLLSFFSCQKNPTSSKSNELLQIKGVVTNNYSESYGALWEANVSLVTGNDTLSTITDNKGFFFFESNDLSFEDSIKISLSKPLYKDENYQIKVPETAKENQVFKIESPLKMRLSEEAMYITGTLERSVEDDSVVVHLYESGCQPYLENHQQYLGESSIFSIAVSKNCEELGLLFVGKNHRRTEWNSINIDDFEILENPARIEGLHYKLYPKQEVIPVTVRIQFYTQINNEVVPTLLHENENFTVITPKGDEYPIELLLDENGIAEIQTEVEVGADTLSIYMKNSNEMHYFPKQDFPLLDYEINNNNIIYLGKHEVIFDGVYVWGTAKTNYYDYKGDFTLKVNESEFPIKKGSFKFPAPRSLDAYNIKIDAQYYEWIDTLIHKSDLAVNNQKITGLNLELTPTLFQTTVKVNFIGINGQQLPPRSISVFFGDLLWTEPQQYITNSSGALNTELKPERKDKLVGLTVNADKHASNFTFTEDTLNFNNHENYELYKEVSVYELGPKINYTPIIQVGTEWVYDYNQTVISNDIQNIDTGTLTWEIIDQNSDSTFIMETKFDGENRFYNYNGGPIISESEITGGKYLLTVADQKLKFEPLEGDDSKLTIFLRNLDYQVDTNKPSTFNKSYTELKMEDHSIGLQKLTLAEEEGISKYSYRNRTYGIYINVKLVSYKP